VVVKLGGGTIEDPAIVKSIILDVVFMEQVGMLPVLVHGGGVFISEALKARGVQSKFIGGYRVTDDQTLEVAVDVLKNRVNRNLTDLIRAADGEAVGMAEAWTA